MEQAVEEDEAVVAEAAIDSFQVDEGPVSRGQPQNCMEVRKFKNFVDSYHHADE